MQIIDPKSHDVVVAEVVNWMLPHLEVMPVEQIRDNLLGAIQMYIDVTFYGKGADGKIKQMTPVPQKYADALKYIREIYDRNLDPETDKLIRDGYIVYCYEVKLRSEGLGSTLRGY